jgi:hypothetical protein
MARKVFFSYGNSDSARLCVDQLSREVRAAGFEPVVPEKTMMPGTDWRETVEKELASSDAYVFVVDPAASRSGMLQTELEAAVRQSWANPDKPMIPVVVGDAELPGFLSDRQAVHIAPGQVSQTAIDAVLAAVAGHEAPAERGARVERGRSQRKQRLSDMAAQSEQFLPSQADIVSRHQELSQELESVRSSAPQSREAAEVEVKLADAARALNNFHEVVMHLERALAIYESFGKRERTRAVERRIARIHANLGSALDKLGRLPESRDHWRAALDFYEDLTDVSMKVYVHQALVDVCLRLGDPEGAKQHRNALRRLLGGLSGIADVATNAAANFVSRWLK